MEVEPIASTHSSPGNSAISNGMEEALWSMSQRSRALQDLRKDIHQVWNDEAAREINSRYLNPHETDSARMGAALNDQSTHLHEAELQVEMANDLALRVDEFAAKVAEKLQFAEQDLASFYSNYDQYVQYTAEAKSRFPMVRQMISRANSACQ